MNSMRLPTLASATLLSALAFGALAAQSNQAPLQTGETPRPSDTNANKASESGAQTTTPSGAATGAGQPQGRAQPGDAQSAGSAKTQKQQSASAKSKSSAKTKHVRSDKKRATKRKNTKASPAG